MSKPEYPDRYPQNLLILFPRSVHFGPCVCLALILEDHVENVSLVCSPFSEDAQTPQEAGNNIS